MMKSAITISLVPELAGGPFVFFEGLELGCLRAAELGFDAVEILAPSPAALLESDLKELLATNHLELDAVGTGAGWLLHKLSLTDQDSSRRAKAVEFVAGLIDAAAEFGAPCVIGSIQGKASEGMDPAEARQLLVAPIEELSARAHERGTDLLIEPLNRYESNVLNTLEQGVRFIGDLSAGNVKLLADLFHMNIEERCIPDAIMRATEHVGHVHFADSNRQAVGFGHTDFVPIMDSLRHIGYSGYLSAEVLPLPDSDGAAAQTIASFKRFTQS